MEFSSIFLYTLCVCMLNQLHSHVIFAQSGNSDKDGGPSDEDGGSGGSASECSTFGDRND